jgi:hypothetical protein
MVLDESYETVKSRAMKVVLNGEPAALEALSGEGILSKEIQGGAAAVIAYPWTDEVRRKLEAASRTPLETSAPSLEEIFIGFVS